MCALGLPGRGMAAGQSWHALRLRATAFVVAVEKDPRLFPKLPSGGFRAKRVVGRSFYGRLRDAAHSAQGAFSVLS